MQFSRARRLSLASTTYQGVHSQGAGHDRGHDRRAAGVLAVGPHRAIGIGLDGDLLRFLDLRHTWNHAHQVAACVYFDQLLVQGGSILLGQKIKARMNTPTTFHQTASRWIGQVMQCPPPRPLPSSKPAMAITSTPAWRILAMV